MSAGSHLERLGNTVSTTLPNDADGYCDRECPTCERVFKVLPGTGLSDIEHCICPYCGRKEAPDHFYTKEQIRYARESTVARVADALGKDIEDIFRPHRGGGLISVNVKAERRSRPHYRHCELPTPITCEHCTCQYKIDGEAGLCPDCGASNSA